MKLLDKNKTKKLEWLERFRKENEVLEFSKGSWIATGKYVYCEKLENKIKKLLTQQRTELLEEIKTRVDTCGGFEDGGGNLCHYDSEILEWVNDLLNKKL